MNYFTRFSNSLARLARSTRFSTFLFAGVLCLSFAAYADQVVDEETGKPLEGVFVMVSWWSDGPSIAITTTVCYAFETLKTDKDGKFTMPKYSWNLNPLLWERRRSVELYLAGYVRSPNDFHNSDVAIMRRFKGTAEERLKKLTSVGYRASCVPESQRKEKLAPLYKAQLQEARDIAQNGKNQSFVELLRGRFIEAELGYGSYSKMQTEEMKK